MGFSTRPERVSNLPVFSLPDSRADRFQEALSMISDGKSAIEELKDELQTWYDNLPESLQSGEKGETLDNSVSELDDIISTSKTWKAATLNSRPCTKSPLRTTTPSL